MGWAFIPPLPNQQSDGFLLEFELKEPQTELQTRNHLCNQHCEQTLPKLQTNREFWTNGRFWFISLFCELGVAHETTAPVQIGRFLMGWCRWGWRNFHPFFLFLRFFFFFVFLRFSLILLGQWQTTASTGKMGNFTPTPSAATPLTTAPAQSGLRSLCLLGGNQSWRTHLSWTYREGKISAKFSCIKFFWSQPGRHDILAIPCLKQQGRATLNEVFVRDIPGPGSEISRRVNPWCPRNMRPKPLSF